MSVEEDGEIFFDRCGRTYVQIGAAYRTLKPLIEDSPIPLMPILRTQIVNPEEAWAGSPWDDGEVYAVSLQASDIRPHGEVGRLGGSRNLNAEYLEE